MDADDMVELTGAVWRAMDGGADDGDVQDVVNQAIGAWQPKDPDPDDEV